MPIRKKSLWSPAAANAVSAGMSPTAWPSAATPLAIHYRNSEDRFADEAVADFANKGVAAIAIQADLDR